MTQPGGQDEQSYEDSVEDEGVLEPADTLDGGDLRDDVLDTGIDAGEGYRGATRYGTTGDEEERGESLDQQLAAEEPEQADDDWTDEEAPSDDDRPGSARAGRLVAPDEGARPGTESDLVAFDVGVDGAGASAEEAAVHETDEPPFD